MYSTLFLQSYSLDITIRKKLQKLIFWNHLTTTLTKQARLSDKNIDKNTLFWKNGTMTTFNIFSK